MEHLGTSINQFVLVNTEHQWLKVILFFVQFHKTKLLQAGVHLQRLLFDIFTNFLRLRSFPSGRSFNSSFVQFEPKCDYGQYMHCHNNSTHQVNIIIGIEFIDANFFQKCGRFSEVTVAHGRIVRTIQIWSIHTINGIDDTMKTGTEIANVPHPTEYRCYVLISRTKSKHRE